MKVTKEIDLGGKIFSLETGRFAKQADGAVMARFGDTMVLATVVAQQEAKREPGLLPAPGGVPREVRLGGKDSRRVLQARSPAVRKGSPLLPPDRPADPPDVPGVVPVRNAGHRHRLLVRPGTRRRRARRRGRLRGADDLRHPVRRARSRRSASDASTASWSSTRRSPSCRTATWTSPSPARTTRS